jgi:sugar phosphate isomerase/epimerase
MRLGCCGTLEDAGVMRDAGFDFLEVNIQGVLKGDEPSSTWDAQAPDISKLALPIEAANSMLPAAHAVIGPKRDMAGLQAYMERIAPRAKRLGIQRLVFGSGGARRRPEDVSPDDAMKQIIEFCAMAADVCARHDVMVVVEHLHSGECNTINRLDETRAICEAVGNPNLMGLVDSFHYGMEKDTEQAVLDLGPMIRHVHIAEPDGRAEPGRPASAENAFDFEDFFCLLRKTGYNERISIEARWSGPLKEKAPAVVKMLREAWSAAGKCES